MDTADEEWEYEYDDGDIQPYYLTLDFQLEPPAAPAKPVGNATTKSTSATPKQSTDKSDQSDDPDEQSDFQALAEPDAQTKDNAAIQFVDLHGQNPGIMYKERFYSCDWASDIGTSLFIGELSQDSEQAHQSLRKFATSELIGMSRARLCARPAVLKTRVAAQDPDRAAKVMQAPDAFVSATSAGDSVRYSLSQGLKIDLHKNAPSQKISQARFLERLAAIRLQKGISEHVPIKPIKEYDLPKDWETERDEWIAKEADLDADQCAADVPLASREHPPPDTAQQAKRARHGNASSPSVKRPVGRPRKIKLTDNVDKTTEEAVVDPSSTTLSTEVSDPRASQAEAGKGMTGEAEHSSKSCTAIPTQLAARADVGKDLLGGAGVNAFPSTGPSTEVPKPLAAEAEVYRQAQDDASKEQ